MSQSKREGSTHFGNARLKHFQHWLSVQRARLESHLTTIQKYIFICIMASVNTVKLNPAWYVERAAKVCAPLSRNDHPYLECP